MKTLGKSLLYGLLLWAVIFAAAIFIFPLKSGNYPFFETLISIFLCLFTVIASIMYFRQTELNLKNALSAGLIWMAVNIIIDVPLFSYGPMKKSLIDYFKDIGFTYLIIPIITSGIALAARNTGKFLMDKENGKK